ncbi:MAG: hypothetical protein JWQ35_2528 [Bacteriovoracaceae bacterium]|nr:hypothetical protein [Bacteriovoracaceae bacterium]
MFRRSQIFLALVTLVCLPSLVFSQTEPSHEKKPVKLDEPLAFAFTETPSELGALATVDNASIVETTDAPKGETATLFTQAIQLGEKLKQNLIQYAEYTKISDHQPVRTEASQTVQSSKDSSIKGQILGGLVSAEKKSTETHSELSLFRELYEPTITTENIYIPVLRRESLLTLLNSARALSEEHKDLFISSELLSVLNGLDERSDPKNGSADILSFESYQEKILKLVIELREVLTKLKTQDLSVLSKSNVHFLSDLMKWMNSRRIIVHMMSLKEGSGVVTYPLHKATFMAKDVGRFTIKWRDDPALKSNPNIGTEFIRHVRVDPAGQVAGIHIGGRVVVSYDKIDLYFKHSLGFWTHSDTDLNGYRIPLGAVEFVVRGAHLPIVSVTDYLAYKCGRIMEALSQPLAYRADMPTQLLDVRTEWFTVLP